MEWADPIVSETGNCSPDAAVRRSRSLSSRRATVASLRVSASASTTNSSPPIRATMSDSRNVPSSAWAQSTRAMSPALWPKLSLMAFRLSTSA